MYFFSGEATCLKVMPACAVMSVKEILAGCELKEFVSRKGAKMERKTAKKKAKVLFAPLVCAFARLREKSLIRLLTRFFFQLFRDLELALALSFAAGGDVGATELIVNVWLVRTQAHGDLEIRDAAFHVAFLKQRFAQLVTRVGKLRLLAHDLAHDRDASLRLLLGQQDVRKVILRLKVVRIYVELRLKLTRGFGKFSRLELNQTGVEVGQPHFLIERQRTAQLFERFVDFTAFVVRLAEKDVKLRRVFTDGHHLFDHAIRFVEFAVLHQREREWIIKCRLLRLRSHYFSQECGCTRVVTGCEVAEPQQLLDADVC